MSPLWFQSILIAGLISTCIAANEDYVYGTTKVRFLGKSPNFQIYPNTSQDVYLQLRFSKIAELDSTGSAVQGHSVTSLASANPVWETGVVSAGGVNYTYVSMTLDPATRQGFNMDCPSTSNGNGNGNGNGNAGRRLLGVPVLHRALAVASSNATLKIKVFFGMTNTTYFQYGKDQNVTVSQNGLKFNIEYQNWPFCNTNNTLSAEIDILVKGGNATGIKTATESDGSKSLTLTAGELDAKVNFANYAYEGVNGTRKMNVTVALGDGDQKGTVKLQLPNPAPNTTAYYDPTVTTTLGGSAGALRTTFWAAMGMLVTVLLWL